MGPTLSRANQRGRVGAGAAGSGEMTSRNKSAPSRNRRLWVPIRKCAPPRWGETPSALEHESSAGLERGCGDGVVIDRTVGHAKLPFSRCASMPAQRGLGLQRVQDSSGGLWTIITFNDDEISRRHRFPESQPRGGTRSSRPEAIRRLLAQPSTTGAERPDLPHAMFQRRRDTWPDLDVLPYSCIE